MDVGSKTSLTSIKLLVSEGKNINVLLKQKTRGQWICCLYVTKRSTGCCDVEMLVPPATGGGKKTGAIEMGIEQGRALGIFKDWHWPFSEIKYLLSNVSFISSI